MNNQGTTSDSYLAEDEIYPDPKSDRFKSKLEEVYRDVAIRVNERQIGVFDFVEANTGQKFFGEAGEPRRKRESLRKVFQIDGPIASGAVVTEAHDITNVDFYTHIYGTIETNVPDHRPLPYTDATGTNEEVSLRVDGTNIIIENGTAAPQIDSVLVVLEYIKN